jgi:hypothetical protein
LLSFGAECFVFKFAIKKLKDWDTQKYIILYVLLNWCETWSLTLTEGRKLKVFQNRVLRKYLGLKELTGDWRRLRNEDIYDLHSSTNIFREMKSIRMRWAGNRAHMGKR